MPETYPLPQDYESISVSSSVVKFSDSKVNPSEGTNPPIRAVITIEGNSMRYRYDGEDPSSSDGHLLNSGDSLILLGQPALERFRIIRLSADGTIRITYESEIEL